MTNLSGKKAETAAKHYLCQQKLAFIEENYSCRQGEIDLIMKEDRQLVFVEVKYRKNNTFGDGFEHVTWHKQQRIIKTARHYLHTHKIGETVSCRFDVVSITPSPTKHSAPLSIQWIRNAFTLC
ncbi:YraN family protein [Eionea flava]